MWNQKEGISQRSHYLMLSGKSALSFVTMTGVTLQGDPNSQKTMGKVSYNSEAFSNCQKAHL